MIARARSCCCRPVAHRGDTVWVERAVGPVGQRRGAAPALEPRRDRASSSGPRRSARAPRVRWFATRWCSGIPASTCSPCRARCVVKRDGRSDTLAAAQCAGPGGQRASRGAQPARARARGPRPGAAPAERALLVRAGAGGARLGSWRRAAGWRTGGGCRHRAKADRRSRAARFAIRRPLSQWAAAGEHRAALARAGGWMLARAAMRAEPGSRGDRPAAARCSTRSA